MLCHYLVKISDHTYCGSRDIFLDIYLAKPRAYRAGWLYQQKPLKVSSSEDMIVLVCHVILQDHVTTGPSNFMNGNNFSGNKHCDIGDIIDLVYHVISQDHVFKRSCYFMGRSPSRKVIILLSLLGISIVAVEI